jgi:hypothetical protein
LNSLTEAAQADGIGVTRSQVRSILMAEKVRWRHCGCRELGRARDLVLRLPFRSTGMIDLNTFRNHVS